jgi:glycosyltransferase involved in cell wall biosynthesis
VERVLASLDVLVLTSLWEGLPRVLVQAAAMGRPCVSFDVEGAREIVEDGVNGYVVPKRDVAALVNRIDSLISNRASAEAMGQRGRSKVTAEWDVKVMVQRISKTYDSVVWNGRGGINEDNRNT